ncbi:HepT-like ribonuclease domain-containing protein [Sulfurospirillum deleyianum]|uniref:DUF86 domain-containing protein n=1 Tax=Sulfurospirillum deleyianum (strain ATCC 51133 / DSM 6946 / 5175) TaxID=525898 RepID=D1AZA3_SULD5|nr:HepT-like ribonuclease domain-containing protein [Sulfurospirillum deleyianum]ACZ11370.1 protein of unknown function DUF86 [Sulfurospirillum deleyianum DSM 6946]
MSNRDISLYIVDIFIAIDKISRFTCKIKNGAELLVHEMAWDACIRELEIIGEATRILLNSGLLKSEYRRIVDFRNQISHGYFGIDEEIVWDVIAHKLPEYQAELVMVVSKEKIALVGAIEHAKAENEKNVQVLKFLEILMLG